MLLSAGAIEEERDKDQEDLFMKAGFLPADRQVDNNDLGLKLLLGLILSFQLSQLVLACNLTFEDHCSDPLIFNFPQTLPPIVPPQLFFQ